MQQIRNRIDVLNRYRERLEAGGATAADRLARSLAKDGPVRVADLLPAGIAGGGPPVPPRLVQFWDRDPPEQVRTMLSRNAEMAAAAGLDHRVFDEAAAAAFLDGQGRERLAAFFRAAGHPAMKADIFRLAYLLAEGGVYLDADVVLDRPIDVDGLKVPVLFQRTWRAPHNVLNWFMIAPPDHRLFRAACARVETNLATAPRDGDGRIAVDGIIGLTGPGVVTAVTVSMIAEAGEAAPIALLDHDAAHGLTRHGRRFLKEPLAYKGTDRHWKQDSAGAGADRSQRGAPAARRGGAGRRQAAPGPAPVTAPASGGAPKKTVFLHIGAPKTGTTSLQTAFATHRDLLRDNGILYSRSSRNHGTLMFLVRRNARAAAGRPAEDDPGDRKLQRKETFLREEFAGFEGAAAVYSCEALSHLTGDRVAVLRDTVAGLFADPEIVILLYVRHPLSLAVSHLQERIKGSLLTFEEVLAEPIVIDFPKVITSYQEVFGADRVRVRKYDPRPLVGGSTAADVLAQIGLADLADRVTAPRANSSLSMNAVMVGDRVNRHLAANPRFPLADNWRARKRKLLLEIPGEPYSVPPDHVERLRAMTVDQLPWLERHVGLTFDEPVVPPMPAPQTLMAPDEIQAHAARVLAALGAGAAADGEEKAARRRGARRRDAGGNERPGAAGAMRG